jgi:hypothetical protein
MYARLVIDWHPEQKLSLAIFAFGSSLASGIKAIRLYNCG